MIIIKAQHKKTLQEIELKGIDLITQTGTDILGVSIPLSEIMIHSTFGDVEKIIMASLGRKGGQKTALNQKHMSIAGKKGAAVRWGKK